MLKILAVSFVIIYGLRAHPMPGQDSPKNFNPKIIGGENARKGEYPYMVSLHSNWNGQEDVPVCGGAILTNKWVITGGFCCYGLNTGLYIYLVSGSYQLSQPGQRHEIGNYVLNENYSIPTGPENDICLIQIEDEFEFNDDTREVSLPQQGFEVNDGDSVTVTGWGTINLYQISTPDRLQVGRNFTVISKKACAEATSLPTIAEYDFFLCAVGNSGRSICVFDFGDPLVKDGVIVGVASYYGASCSTMGYPDIYARVPYYIDWIQQSLGEDAKNLKFAK